MDVPDLLRNFQQLKRFKFDEERYKTSSSIDQVRCNEILIELHLPIGMFLRLTLFRKQSFCANSLIQNVGLKNALTDSSNCVI